VLGKLSDARYMKLSAQYETEQAEIGRLAKALEQEIESEAGPVADVGRLLQLADRYSDLRELDAAAVNELIEKIVIHSPEKIGGKKHVTIEVSSLMWEKSASRIPSRSRLKSQKNRRNFCHAGFTGNFIYFPMSLCLMWQSFFGV